VPISDQPTGTVPELPELLPVPLSDETGMKPADRKFPAVKPVPSEPALELARLFSNIDFSKNNLL
jgi:hypothetical protein